MRTPPLQTLHPDSSLYSAAVHLPIRHGGDQVEGWGCELLLGYTMGPKFFCCSGTLHPEPCTLHTHHTQRWTSAYYMCQCTAVHGACTLKWKGLITC